MLHGELGHTADEIGKCLVPGALQLIAPRFPCISLAIYNRSNYHSHNFLPVTIYLGVLAEDFPFQPIPAWSDGMITRYPCLDALSMIVSRPQRRFGLAPPVPPGLIVIQVRSGPESLRRRRIEKPSYRSRLMATKTRPRMSTTLAPFTSALGSAGGDVPKAAATISRSPAFTSPSLLRSPSRGSTTKHGSPTVWSSCPKCCRPDGPGD